MLRDFNANKVWRRTQHENDGLSKYGNKDLLGYAGHPPAVKWPKGAKVALNFVIHYEDGGELCVLHGDKSVESGPEGERLINNETLCEYGPRAGFWRLHRLFVRKKVPCTVFAVGMALERNPVVCNALKEQTTWEIASHSYRFMDYQHVDEATEREHIARSIKIHERLLGKRPAGFFQGSATENTRKIVCDSDFKYDSDSYADDLPYWTLDYSEKPHLIIPFTLTEDDGKDTFYSGCGFLNSLKDGLREALEEGRAGHPTMMSVGIHCKTARPARAAAIADFMDYAKSFGREVWICTREQIADFWYEKHYPIGVGSPCPFVEEATSATADGAAADADATVVTPSPSPGPSTEANEENPDEDFI